MFEAFNKSLPLLYVIILGFSAWFYPHISPELSLICISIYLFFFLSVSSLLKSYFLKTSQQIGIFLLASLAGYFMSGSMNIFLLLLVGISLIFLPKIDTYTSFLGGIITISLGILFHFLGDNSGIETLLYIGFFFFLLGISLEILGENRKSSKILSILISCVTLGSIGLSFYFPLVSEILLPITLASIIIQKIFPSEPQNTNAELSLLSYISTLAFFIIVFTPIIDIHLKIENKQYLLFICFSIYIVLVFVYNKIVFKK